MTVPMSSVMSSVMSLPFRNPFSSSIREMVMTFSTSTYKVGLKLLPNEQDTRVPVLVWATCAYTIQTIGTHAHTHKVLTRA